MNLQLKIVKSILSITNEEFQEIMKSKPLKLIAKKALAKAIAYHRDLYYDGTPEISDEDFDNLLFDRLKELNPKHELIKATGSKPKDNSPWKKAKHEMKMFSLTKMHSTKDLIKFVEKMKSSFTIQPSIELFIEDKLDGFSIEVIYDKGKYVAGITRGDGKVGEDISRNVIKMQNVKKEVNFKRRFSLRGEIMLFHKEFNELNEIKKRNGEPTLVNPRNATSGCKRLEGENVEYFKVVFYDAYTDIPFKTEEEKLLWIQSLGFEVVEHKKVKSTKEAEDYYNEVYMNRLFLDYDIDGQVVKLNDLVGANKIDEGETIPKSQKAWKFPNTKLLCKTEREIWSIKTGSRITPVAVIKPLYVVPNASVLTKLEKLYQNGNATHQEFEKLKMVKIKDIDHMRKLIGANIERATLNNLDWIKNELNEEVGTEDFIIVERANDVIPKITYVVHKSGKEIVYPKVCPRCGETTEAGEKFLICTNIECPAKALGILMDWIDALEIRDISLETLEKFYELKLVEEPSDFYKLTVDEIAEIDGMGHGIGDKILSQFHSKKEITLLELLSGIGIDNIGSKTIDKIINEYDITTIDEIRSLTVDKIALISGLGEKTGEQFLNGITNRKEIIDNLLKEISLIIPEKVELKSNKFEGLSFCVTGKLSKPRKEIEAYISENFGKLSGVNKKLDYLVLGEDAGSKLTKAQSLGINIISEEELMKL